MKVVVVLFLCVLAGGAFAFNWYAGVFGELVPAGEEGVGQDRELHAQISSELSVQELEVEVSTPEPLRAETAGPAATLTQAGVLQWTNAHRQQTGVSALRRDILLDSLATEKLDDMFARQYFAHVSPSGQGIGEVAQESGYKYISIGENLALGNYEDDQDLVQAWMDSPGHRENIVNSKFSRIGIAVGQGVFEGQTTWLAVQVFALPLEACDVPAESLKADIDLKKIQIMELGAILGQERQFLESTFPKQGPAWRNKVDDYNELVARYNSLVQQVEGLIAQYNTQVQEFNECARQ